MCIWELYVLSAQLCHEPETALKIKHIYVCIYIYTKIQNVIAGISEAHSLACP